MSYEISLYKMVIIDEPNKPYNSVFLSIF